ncbi:MAG TPA: hypothetical protein VNQ73_21045 [Ilumatobacter sp.]|nr:hypothetical protein [Ilumatobacter sp.]
MSAVPADVQHLVSPRVEFCGIDAPIDRTPFSIGRDGDLVLDDDNRYLHRRFLVVDCQHGLWTIANVGTQLSVSVSDQAGRVEAHLAPGGVLPLASTDTTVRFSAGPTAYELSVHVPAAGFRPGPLAELGDADATMGRVALSPEQLLVVVALAEPILCSGHLVAAALPSNAEASDRLGWTVTKFNRKLDVVCTKLTARGVRGLRGGPERLATNRRARLVEYAITAQLVTVADLGLLDRCP